ncbi:hypothetical protein NX059_009680 [Plenodomus lindquistii]|nr:hypothetical protein NX059_009680 [Plenodomus lindquistii]
MHFLPLFLALIGLFLNVATGLPTEIGPFTPANLTAAIAKATANRGPNTISKFGICGQFTIKQGGFAVPTFTSDICTNTDQFETMVLFENWGCGLCIVFDGRQCQGDIRWSGGPHPTASHHVDGAQSYFCY